MSRKKTAAPNSAKELENTINAGTGQQPTTLADGNYEVGYGKPPKHSRFRPGQSGNSRGRPRGSLNISTMLRRALCERVVVREKGKLRTFTKLDAAFRDAATKAAKGDPKSLQQLLAALRLFAQELAVNEESKTQDEADERVFASLVKRIRQSTEKEE